MPAAGHMLWRKQPLTEVIRACNSSWVVREECSRRDVFQFGVYLGRSMRAISLWLLRHRLSIHTFWGFDSFVGMPKDDTYRGKLYAMAMRRWQPGTVCADCTCLIK